MQDKVYKFVQKQVNEKGIKGRVLDVGSLDVNGSLRPLFPDYFGVDMRAGKNVDIVANSHLLPFKNKSFDLVVCVETLEHDDQPFKTMSEIYRVLKDGGWCIITAPYITFPKHCYPSDYWRFTAEAFKVLLKKFKNVEAFEDENETYGIGQKLK